MAEVRQRIVIDLENKAPGAFARPRSRKRWPKILAILALAGVVVIALLAAGGYFWWQRYRTKPAYSLALLIDAARRDDMATLEQLIDVDKIAASLLTELTDRAAARYGAGLNQLEKQRVQALTPALLPEVKRTIREESNKATKDLAAQAGNKPFLLLALAAPYIVNINVADDAATVSLVDRETQFTMAKNGERWQVVSVKDEQIVQRLVDRLTIGLPPVGQFFDDRPRGQPPGPKRRRRR